MDDAPDPTSAPPQDLVALVYVSKAARPMSSADLLRLLVGARRRNAEADVTGVLLYADGAFMQYLEGPAPALRRIYAIIKADPLHYGLVSLVREPIRERHFAEWSMGCHVVGQDEDAPALSQNFALLARRVGQALRPGSTADAVLRTFWSEGRTAAAPMALRYGRPPLPAWVTAASGA